MIDLFSKTNNIIDRSQIGFQKGHRPTDHIFTLKTLINKHVYNTPKGKLYACFVDFKKAYDSVWHKGLFTKLASLNVTESFLNLII